MNFMCAYRDQPQPAWMMSDFSRHATTHFISGQQAAVQLANSFTT